MVKAQGCCPQVRLLLCLSFAVLTLTGCSSSLAGPPYCAAKPPILSPASGPGGPLHQRALAYDRLFQEKLQPRPYGGAVNVIFQQGSDAAPLGTFVGYDDQQDSAIWTGTYLAAQAFRYAATTDPAEKQEALRNAKNAAQTLHIFLKVTGQTGLIARFAGPLDEAETYLGSILTQCEGSNVGPDVLCCNKWPCGVGTWNGSQLFWLGGTTRDQYSGWFFGMGIAYRLIDDPELRQLIGTDMKEVITALRSEKWTIRSDGKPTRTSGARIEPLMQAAWLLLAAEASGDPALCQDYEKLVRNPLRRDILLVEDDFDWTNRYLQYYGFNLSFLAFYNLILLEPQEARRQAYLKVLEDHTYKEVKGTGNSFFDYIALAVGAEAPAGTLESAQSSLEQFQDPPGRWSCVLPPKTQQLNPLSVELYDLSKKLNPVKPEILPEAAQPYPLKSWCSQDFLWQQSPYEICCCQVAADQQWSQYQSACECMTPQVAEGQAKVYPGVDYLVAYWMGRYHGFLKPES